MQTPATMQKPEEVVYSIDRVRILFRDRKKKLGKKLPLLVLKHHCRRIHFERTEEYQQNCGYFSKLEVGLPGPRFFEILEKHIPTRYYITYIEIARDMVYPEKYVTETVFDTLLRFIRKKYSHEYFIYDVDKSNLIVTDTEDDLKYRHEKYSSKTCYLGGKRFKHVTYPRISKVSKKPCIHSEWRISGSRGIKKKTGIRTIRDLMEFDIQSCYERLAKNFIVFEEIDCNKHGRFIQNMPQRAKEPGVIRSGKNVGGQLAKPELSCRMHNTYYRIESPLQLWKYYKDEQKRIKTMMKAGGAKLTIREERILKLSYYKLNSFIKLTPAIPAVQGLI